MPQNCSVPYCTEKEYEENGMKISYHKFPEDKDVFKQYEETLVKCQKS